jgi:hypothetical protein
VGIPGVALAIDQVTLSDVFSPIKRGGYKGYIFPSIIDILPDSNF